MGWSTEGQVRSLPTIPDRTGRARRFAACSLAEVARDGRRTSVGANPATALRYWRVCIPQQRVQDDRWQPMSHQIQLASGRPRVLPHDIIAIPLVEAKVAE